MGDIGDIDLFEMHYVFLICANQWDVPLLCFAQYCVLSYANLPYRFWGMQVYTNQITIEVCIYMYMSSGLFS